MDMRTTDCSNDLLSRQLRRWISLRLHALLEVTVRIATALTLGMFLCGALKQYALDPSRITVILFVVSEAVAVALALCAKIPAKRDWNVTAVFLSIFATLYYLAFDMKPGAHLIPEWVAALLQIAGMLLQISAKLSLRRSFGLLPANRGVVTSGPYRFVRHPMYLGYLISDLGFLLPSFCMQNLLIILLQWALQMGRILREEKLLSADPTYQEYAQRVRHRFVKGIF